MIQKGSYNIRRCDGLKKVDGYIYTTYIFGEQMSFGITQYEDGYYIVTDLSTGMRFPIETNRNLMTAIFNLKVFIKMRGEIIKKARKEMIKNMGEQTNIVEVDNDED